MEAANDSSVDFAAGCGLLGFRTTRRLDLGPDRLEHLGNVDTLADRRVARREILNEPNQRVLKTSAGRNFLASVRWSQDF